ncbi:MAG: DegT/DnrJ/EryC1/StrS family aminotransferase [Bacteroidia bacterium]|nr:DegT/DnrJ/EryC1/StrS family aminotransferase [Bacteroidia bacterium]
MIHPPEFIVFGQPRIESEEIDEIISSLRSAWLGTGPKVARFEDMFREYKGASYAAALHSCTAALHLSLLAAGVGPGDEVITTPMTFCATINAIIHSGAVPVLVDVDEASMNITAAAIEAAITPRTKAIMPVHFAGRCCDMVTIMKLAEEHELMVIEDCAHAIESTWHGRQSGSFGDFACFSFYATKNITTGEGGMVLARREEHIDRIKMLGLHGMSRDAWKRFGDDGYKHYQVLEAGFKYNMMDLQAAIGLHQLERIEQYWQRREAIWLRYMEAFADLPVTLPAPIDPASRHALHLFTLLIDEQRCGISRDGFLDRMTQEGIGVGVHYLSIPEHPYYRERYGWLPEQYPQAMHIGRQTVSIPLSPKLSDGDVDRIIHTVRGILLNTV